MRDLCLSCRHGKQSKPGPWLFFQHSPQNLMLNSSNIQDDLLVHLSCLDDHGWDILIITLLAGGTEAHIAVTINIIIVHHSAVDAAAVAKTITKVEM